MRKINFENIKNFCEKVDTDFQSIVDDSCSLSIIAKYDEARKIIQELVKLGYELNSIANFTEPDYGGYYNEYIISLSCIDYEKEIWCEPMLIDKGYIDDDGVVAYVFGDCNSKCLPHLYAKLVYEIEIQDNDSDECDWYHCDHDYWDDHECEECCCSECVSKDTNECESTYVSKNENGVPVGFSKSWSTTENGVNCYSSYSHYSDDLDMLKEIAEKFGVRL